MNVVLYFQPPTKRSDSLKLQGAKQIAQKLAWQIQAVESLPSTRGIKDMVAFWNPVGAIVECDGWPTELDPSVFTCIPTVFLDPPKEIEEQCVFSVSHDSRATGREAARHLLQLGRRNFAYIPFRRDTPWSRDREEAFVKALSLNGFGCSVLEPTQPKEDATKLRRRRREFLTSLPLPCSLFAANDETADDILTLAAHEGLDVPEDLAVLGVDNYEPICENTTPSLSSVEPDFLRCGELAALLLAAYMRDGKHFRGSRRRTFGPARTVVRASTRTTVAGTDRTVAKALETIRRKACNGMRVEDVLKLFPCSTPVAYARFKKIAGHTILEEIHAVQLERVKELLSDPSMQLKSISDFCGFTNPNSLRKFFLRETGMTMSQWREENLRQSAESEGL